MTRRRIAVACLAGLLLAAGSCDRPAKKRIGVVPKAVAHVFWQSVHAGAAAAAQESGVQIEWKGPPAETDFARQIEIVDAMVNQRLDGIVLAPTEATALVTVVERAETVGIPVTIFDSGINTDRYVSFVATDNFEAGKLAARTLAEIIAGKGKIAMVMMVPGAASNVQREEGFQEAIEEEFPEIEIADQKYCMSDRARALAVAENMLTAHPDLEAIFASAEPATVGAAQALRSRELAGKVKMVGFDFGDAMETGLRDGIIDALIVQDPFNIGYKAVKTIVAKIAGETPAKRIDSPATVVTLKNLDDPEIDALVHPDLSKYLE